MIRFSTLWLQILLTIAVGFAVSFASTPIVKSFAQKVGAIDVPRDAPARTRPPHPAHGRAGHIPRLPHQRGAVRRHHAQVRGILLGAVLIVACGAIDDVISLRAWIKLLVQIAAAVVAVLHGVVIEVFATPIYSATTRR